MQPGRPGCSGDQDDGGQEEAHPGKGGVSRIFDIIVQATPGGDAGGGLAGEAEARVAFADPESEREGEEQEICPPDPHLRHHQMHGGSRM